MEIINYIGRIIDFHGWKMYFPRIKLIAAAAAFPL